MVFKQTLKKLGQQALAWLVLLVASQGVAYGQTALTEVRIGYQKGSPVLVLAKKQQVLEKQLQKLGITQVKWVEFQFGPPMLEALGAGAIDFGAVGDTPPIFSQAAGANVVYVAALPASPHGVLVPKDSAIKTLADLKGKKIAVAKGSSAHNVFIKALKLAGLTLKDVEPVYLSPADATAAFNGGKVDAWVVWDPYYAIAQQRYDARTIADTSDKRLDSYSFYLSNRDFADKNPQLVRGILQEIKSVTDWAGHHKKDLAQIASEATGIDTSSWEKTFAREVFSVFPVGQEQVASQQQLADTFFTLGIVPKQIKVSDIVWTWDVSTKK